MKKFALKMRLEGIIYSITYYTYYISAGRRNIWRVPRNDVPDDAVTEIQHIEVVRPKPTN